MAHSSHPDPPAEHHPPYPLQPHPPHQLFRRLDSAWVLGDGVRGWGSYEFFRRDDSGTDFLANYFVVSGFRCVGFGV